MWPHLLLLLILMMVMMVVLHHAISSWFHTIRCMTILIFIPRALSHAYLKLNTYNQMHEDGKMEMSRWSGRRASPLHRNPLERNLKFQPPHTGNRRPVSSTNQSERGVELLGVVCGAKGVVLCSLRLLRELKSRDRCEFHCLALHSSNICLMLAAWNDIRSIIKCEQAKIIYLGSVLNSGKQKQEEATWQD